MLKVEVREYGDIPPIFENPGLPDQLLAQAIDEQEEEESESIATICLAAICTLITMTISYGYITLLLALERIKERLRGLDKIETHPNADDFWYYVISDY